MYTVIRVCVYYTYMYVYIIYMYARVYYTTLTKNILFDIIDC